jgi:predicted AlkP superfamily phosphohydrolase/phosphomutase
MSRLPLCLAALTTATLSLSSGCGSSRASNTRVIVLGFDGMDYRVARDLMARGLMPNFASVAASGSFAPLGTSTPAQSPVAWSSFITGLPPEGHGIFDFIHRDPKTMVPYLSTTKTEPATRSLSIGSWTLPLSSARVTLLRDGQPFWDMLERHGVPTTVIRMPANFPPSGTATRELSGMGTPDILGTYGTFSYFTSAPAKFRNKTLSGGRVFTVDVVNDIVQSELIGPDNPYRTAARKVSVPFTVYVDRTAPVAKLVVGEEERVLNVGEWSDWVPVDFPLMAMQSLRGMCRFYLKQVRPSFELYASPVNMDPTAPAMRISTPAAYAADLARATGRYYTQGMAEDTKALSDHVLTRDEFLQQAALVGGEVTRQYWSMLNEFRQGLMFYYFENLDQVSHMLWRPRDPGHPAYDAARDAPYARVVEDVYVAFDGIVGETVRRMPPDTTLVVMSDHGFASWRRSFHLNGWLRDHGYLAEIDSSRGSDADLLRNVDWSRTRAYGLGLNGLYLNLAGRESSGIVRVQDADAVIQEIRTALLATIDPKTGHAAVTKAFVRKPDSSAGHADRAPDLIVGYAEGTRVSNESALGAVPAGVIVDNTSEWSGDHCWDPDAVPGILLTNRRLRKPAAGLEQLAGAILAEFGISGFGTSR